MAETVLDRASRHGFLTRHRSAPRRHEIRARQGVLGWLAGTACRFVVGLHAAFREKPVEISTEFSECLKAAGLDIGLLLRRPARILAGGIHGKRWRAASYALALHDAQPSVLPENRGGLEALAQTGQ